VDDRTPVDRPRYALYLLGTVLVGVGVGHTLASPAPLWVRLLELLVISSLAAVVVGSGYYFGQRLGPTQFRWVVYSTLALGTLTGGLSLVSSGLQVLQGYSLNEPVYYAVVMAAGGAAAGPFPGYLYAQVRRANEELSHRHDELLELNERLTVANRVLRHNLRNDLTVVMGVTEHLRDRHTSEELTSQLGLVKRRLDKLTELTEKMKRIRQVWETNERCETDLVETVVDAVAEFRSAHPSVTVTTDLPEQAHVQAHPEFRAAVRELLSNAAAHNDTEDLSVSVRLRKPAGGDDSVTLEIADSGCGLPDMERKVFAESTHSESPLEHGQGLGLRLVHWIVQKSGGSADARTDDGTVVCLDLPEADCEEEATLVRPNATVERIEREAGRTVVHS